MTDPYFFGYGSLVNRATHSYLGAAPALLQGWRRAWMKTPMRKIVLLSAVPAMGHSIQGLIAAVPNGDWDALDLRETGYNRVSSSDAVAHDLPAKPQIDVYAVQSEIMADSAEHIILLSYLDVVVQGYLREFGPDGVQHFFDTTDGWDTAVLDDRAAPIYPRHQVLTHAERALVDHHLARLSTPIQQGHQPALSCEF